jgi:hypothetical protein
VTPGISWRAGCKYSNPQQTTMPPLLTASCHAVKPI